MNIVPAFRRVLVSSALLAALPLTSGAAPLDPETCETLKKTQASLEAAKAREHLALGPTAAKGTLSSEQIAAVKTLIETDEQLYFRCGLAKPTFVLKDEPPDPDATPEPAPKVVKPKAKPKVDQADKPKPKAKQADSGATAPTPAAKKVETGSLPAKANGSGAEPPARKPAPPPKPKSDDAYRGPASGLGLDGQTVQPIRP